MRGGLPNGRLAGGFVEYSFFDKIKILFRGLASQKNSRDYKLAVNEAVQISSAAFSIMIVLAAVIALLAVGGRTDAGKAESVAVAIVEPTVLAELDEPPPAAQELPMPEIRQELFEVALERVEYEEKIQAPTLSPTPQKANAARFIKSPVMMRGVAGSRLPGAVGGSFGYSSGIASDLKGVMYDLKRDAKGNARAPDYWSDLRVIVGSAMSEKTLKEIYRIPRELYLSHIFVPFISASEGPKSFDAGDLMEATQWFAHYSGSLCAETAGRYRFWGAFDDMMIVLIDGKVVMESTWGGVPVSGWKSGAKEGPYTSFITQPFAIGDWVAFRENEPRRIDILVGERPGGMVGGVLLIQDSAAKYAKDDADGRPILPVFTTSKLTSDEEKTLADYPKHKFDMNAPIMNLTPAERQRIAKLKADDEADEIKISIAF